MEHLYGTTAYSQHFFSGHGFLVTYGRFSSILHPSTLRSLLLLLSHRFWLPNFIHTLWGTFRHKWHANTNKAHGHFIYTLFITSSCSLLPLLRTWMRGSTVIKKQCRTAKKCKSWVLILLFQLWCVCYYDGMGLIARKDHACTMMSDIMKNES